MVVLNNNNEINEYFNILCDGDFPSFIIKYLDVSLLKRLSGVGQFCGVDYNKLEFFDLKYWYSRLDHSIACACITWHLTKDRNQILLALFHDVGTPVFSHCVDFMLRDTVNQESSEKPIYDLIINDSKLVGALKEDNVDINIFKNIGNYTIVENSKPKLCVDRLEGVIHSCLIWRRAWNIEDVRSIYQSVVVGINDDLEHEISFDSIIKGKEFFKGVLEYSYSLQKNEDKLSMNLMGDILKLSLNEGLFTFDDLFLLTEEDVINKIRCSKNRKLIGTWMCFEELSEIYRSNADVSNYYSVSIISKNRYVDPYIYSKSVKGRITSLCEDERKMLQDYLDYNDSSYCYIKSLDKQFNLI